VTTDSGHANLPVGGHDILLLARRARCREIGTAGSASGLGKRTGSNPGTAPQADSTSRHTTSEQPCLYAHDPKSFIRNIRFCRPWRMHWATAYEGREMGVVQARWPAACGVTSDAPRLVEQAQLLVGAAVHERGRSSSHPSSVVNVAARQPTFSPPLAATWVHR
jgi:hypothetical protein